MDSPQATTGPYRIAPGKHTLPKNRLLSLVLHSLTSATYAGGTPPSPVESSSVSNPFFADGMGLSASSEVEDHMPPLPPKMAANTFRSGKGFAVPHDVRCIVPAPWLRLNYLISNHESLKYSRGGAVAAGHEAREKTGHESRLVMQKGIEENR